MEEPSEEIEEQEYIPRKREKIKELSFNERVALIGGDHTKFNRRFNVESTSETNFQEALEKWMDQDQGADFEEFLFSIPRKELTTYAQLLHHSDKVFDAITQTLGKKGCKSIPALCEVLTAFARDLREEFFKHMWKSLEVLINVIDLGERDGDSMEAAFIALTTLVKLLAGKLCKQIKTAFTNFLPLFASSRPFARRFAAESFAYLIRKLNDLRPIVQFIVKQTLKTRHEYLSDGLAMLFHNVFIGMSGGFHSSAPDLLRNIVTAVVYNGPEADVDHDELIEYSVEILIQTVNYTSAYAKKSKSPDRLFFQQVITKLLGEAKNMEIATSLMRLVQSCLAEEAAMNVVAKRQKRKESAKRKASQKRATDLPLDFAFADDLRASLNAVVALGDFALNETAVELFAKVINLLLKTTELESFDLYLMPALGKVAQAVLEKENEDEVLVRQVWRFYAYLCSRRKPIEETLGRGTDRSNFFDLFPHQASRKWILEKLNGNLKELREHDEELFLNLLIAWPWIFPSAEVSQASKAVLDFVKTEIGTKREEISSGQLVLVAFAGIFSVSRQLLLEIDLETLSSFVKVQQCRESSLLALELYFEVLGSSSDPELMDRVAQLLTPALMSPTDNARKTALRILSSFHVPLENPEVPSGEKMASKSTPTLFQVLSAAENCELTNFRERLLHLRKLRFGEHRRHMPESREKQYQHLIVRVCVSQFFVQFTPLWKGLHEVLGTFARGMDIDLFWSTMNDCIDNITKKIDAKEDSVGSSILSGLSHVDEISRSDYVNARVQLFAFFAAIPEIAERRTRILAPVLLKLYREEFVPLTESRSKGRKVGKSAEREEEEEEEEEAEEHEEEEEEERTSKGGRSKQEFVDAVKALNSLLRVFSKFGDGRSVYMESKLREIYNEISEDEEDAVVLDEHRSSVIPVLLRVLNGKLNIRETKKGAVSRRNGILRTISGCRPNELSFFFDLHFEKLYKIIGRTATFAEIAEKCRADEFLSSFRPQMITRQFGPTE
ncbi:unnamed protein product [Caenorhabditis auriculariae]|uniref:U3 small nucleolar RNA-associated protein 20 N-terminal domain-containing protein n=1 Tax=Caenorhabditis auriculariae TaxID=2777116 RepID=A0A8S1HVM4_9PELO|nr:unnamed protein product [Caenorhabditis auriculariae]